MAEYIDRQALDVVAFTDRDGTFSDGIQWLLEYIDALPTADAIEVVRCQDCKYYYTTYCEIWGRFGIIQTREKGYCYMGERKDG